MASKHCPGALSYSFSKMERTLGLELPAQTRNGQEPLWPALKGGDSQPPKPQLYSLQGSSEPQHPSNGPTDVFTGPRGRTLQSDGAICSQSTPNLQPEVAVLGHAI